MRPREVRSYVARLGFPFLIILLASAQYFAEVRDSQFHNSQSQFTTNYLHLGANLRLMLQFRDQFLRRKRNDKAGIRQIPLRGGGNGLGQIHVGRGAGRAAEDQVEGVERSAEVEPLRPVDHVQLEQHRRRRP